MKTIHAMIAAAALLAPFAAHAQSAGTTTPETTGSNVGTATTGTTAGGDIGSGGTGTVGSDVGSGGTGTVGSDVGSSGTGTSGSDVGTSGTGTSGSDVGSSGTGTSGSDVGTGGTGTSGSDVGTGGTGTLMTSSPTATAYQPKLTLLAQSTSLRTPGSVKVTVVLSADANLSPAQARDIVVPLASSSSECTLPASVPVAWNSTNGGTASVDVTCVKMRSQAVTISSGTASTSFTTK